MHYFFLNFTATILWKPTDKEHFNEHKTNKKYTNFHKCYFKETYSLPNLLKRKKEALSTHTTLLKISIIFIMYLL